MVSVLYKRDGVVGEVVLNRPQALNAIDDALFADLAVALGEAGADDSAKVVILRGEGRAFCAGGDVDDMPRRRSEEEYRRTRLPIERAVAQAVRGLKKPLIAQIHGAAIGGGCVLAALCDLRVADTNTKFSLPEVKYGTTASVGGIYMLTRIIGLGRAFELLYLANGFDAQRAHAIGFVNFIATSDELAGRTRGIAEEIASHFSTELALTREAILRGLELDFLSAADVETDAAMRAHLGGDIVEGFEKARALMSRKAKT